MEVNGVHGSDQLEAIFNPQEAAGEGTVVLPSPGWEPLKVCCIVHEGHKRPERSVPNVVNTGTPRSKLRMRRTGSLD
eukprot:4300032-Pyramimonas_sp.AAC.1